MRLRNASSMLVLIASLACGGGGDPGGAPADDGSAPVVASSSPTAGSKAVEVGTPIQLVFSKQIRGTYQVSLKVNGTDTPAVTHLSEDGKTLTVDRPALTLPAAVSMQLSGVEDYFGHPLAGQPLTLEWAYPDWIPLGGQLNAPSDARIAVTAGAGPVVAWAKGNVTVLSYNASMSRWDDISDPSARWGSWGYLTSGLALALDPSGSPVVAYYTTASRSDLHVAGYSASAGKWTEYGADQLAKESTWTATGGSSINTTPTGAALDHENGVLQLAIGYAPATSYSDSLGGTMKLFALDGTTWRQRGPTYDTATDSVPVSGIAGTATGVLVAHGSTVRQMLDGGSSWSSIGTPGSNVTAIAMSGSTPLAVASGVVKSYDAPTSTWSLMGTTRNVVALDARGARPVIATRTVSGSTSTATVQEWDAASSAWVQLGASITGAEGIAVVEDADGEVYRVVGGMVSRYNR